jgi:hypothetical protein
MRRFPNTGSTSLDKNKGKKAANGLRRPLLSI